ncbi:MAG: hypothetical protein M1812_007859 [Candelaria pacifica]|nr:MAG: hypothetical protein M1812_007859 [Candelaria pacifica]
MPHFLYSKSRLTRALSKIESKRRDRLRPSCRVDEGEDLVSTEQDLRALGGDEQANLIYVKEIVWSLPLDEKPSKLDTLKGGSSLLNLPIEIRRIVYGFLFTCNRPIILNQVSEHQGAAESPAWPAMSADSGTRGTLSDSLAFLLVSKQFSWEAAEVLYSSNTFSALPTIILFLDLIGKHNCNFLRAIHLYYEENQLVGYSQTLQRLSLLLDLKQLEIAIPAGEPQYWRCYAGITVQSGLTVPYQLYLAYMQVDPYHHFLRPDRYITRCRLDYMLSLGENELEPPRREEYAQISKHCDECQGRLCGSHCSIEDESNHPSEGRPQRRSQILCLPSNVRDLIYQYAFQRSRPTSLKYTVVSWLIPHEYIYPTGFRYASNGYPNKAASLIRVCRQFYHDYSPLLYSKNTFELQEGPPDLWLNQIRTVNEMALRSVHFVYSEQLEYWIPQLRNALGRLARLPHLCEFSFTIERNRVPYLHCIARRLRELRTSLRRRESSSFKVPAKSEKAKQVSGEAVPSFAIILKEEKAQEQSLRIDWVIDKAEPWGWDYRTREWRPYSEIMTQKLLDLGKAITDVQREIVNFKFKERS